VGNKIYQNIADEKSEYYLLSFYGRLNYTFKDRYLFTATLRSDGSSKFSKENHWGLFLPQLLLGRSMRRIS
jgi:iron complex outermembrane receptor protein